MHPLTVPPRSVFTTFMNFPLATDLDRLDAHVAIIGMPYGDPYSIDEVTNDQTNARPRFGAPRRASASASSNGISISAARCSTARPSRSSMSATSRATRAISPAITAAPSRRSARS